ncbi:D-arabinono-1,4-lactone oxidase [Virgibacillus oceani]|uniref:FAD-binding oxidoreductase n=1 Tax=Virgibacillus oceani TaxID=1479511 RepID=A0A917HC13_9BACI|nr:D-arabinono-1,4-lactone oxidase [Virgibacillus oceani]GGG74752.1 FAD-binding oxidoreductase [Virgibacillus oceani]
MFSIKNNKWKNWSETVMSISETFYQPKTLQEVISIVKKCGENRKTLRVVGAGHSFTPLAATSECLISLNHLSGIASIDHEHGLVDVWAGTTLKELGELLHEQGYAMENLGDINVQTLAGAISTGTHGTGIQFGSISTQVTGLTIVTSFGEVLEVSEQYNGDYFQALRVSLGMLGIIVKIKLRVIPSHQLLSESSRMSLDVCLNQLNEFNQKNRHFEFFWFPHTKTVQVKRMNGIHDERLSGKKSNTFNEVVVENGVFWILSEMCRLQPKLSKLISTISAKGIPTAKQFGDSYSLYATPRLVKFREMEYSVPAESMGVVLKDIQFALEKDNFQVHFPIECRYVKQDNIWLSPAYNRDAAYIAVHMYKGMDFQKYFDAIEDIFHYHNGRPHWGKMHTMQAEELEKVYPKFNDFLQVRAELDPNGMFLNDYVRRLFGI